MAGKDTDSSPKKKKKKRNSSDIRVDGLLPNTLYLVNLRFDYKKKKSAKTKGELSDNSDSDSLKYSLNKEDTTSNKECAKIENESIDSNESELDVKESLNVNIDDTNDSCKEGNGGDCDKTVHCKSHLCFVGMDYSCLKYDLSSCSETHFTKDSPDYTSFVISNIFLKKNSDLKFDEASLYDASWEVESVHLCNQIRKFLNTQRSNLSDARSIHDTSAASATSASIKSNDDTASSSASGLQNFTRTDSKSKDGCDTTHTLDTNDASTSINEADKGDIRILDAFCGIGGNFVHFANNFDFSLGVELDENRVRICKNNLEVYGVSGSYSIVNEDFFKFSEEFLEDPKKYFETKLNRSDLYRPDQPQFDWVFLSPPWGGSNYKGSNNDEIYVLEERFSQFYRCLELSSKIGKNVTLFLPRSQSVSEIVKAASLNNFNFVLIDSYLMLPTFSKIRCCMVHLLSDVDIFTGNFTLKNAKKMSPKDFFSPSFVASKINEAYNGKRTGLARTADCEDGLLEKSEIVSILCINNYVYALRHLNLINIGLLMLLNEHNVNVYKKFSLLLQQLPMSEVLRLVNDAIEIYHSNGLNTLTGDKRTLGGTFFYLLKTNYNDTYKNIEKTLKRT